MGRSTNVQRINQHTTLIDVGMRGLARATAAYLVQGSERTCLIDAGTLAEAPRVAHLLTDLGAFPPDMIIPTHAHHDHAQGIPILQREALVRGQSIAVRASSKCIPLLADASYNEVFGNGPYQSIEGVGPIKEGDAMDLGAVTLTVVDLPGHAEDHIGILDETGRTLFIGDALGLQVGGVYLPPFVPPSWDPDAFQDSVGKIQQLDYETLCLTHFGCLRGEEARLFPEKALARTRAWWRLFQDNAIKLDTPDLLFTLVQQELEPGIPDLNMVAPEQEDQAQPPGETFMRGLVAKLGQGCRMFQEAHPGWKW